MDINSIKSQDTWKNVASSLNKNFSTIKSTVEDIEEASIKNKGLYPSYKDLIDAWGDSPNDGDYALIGPSSPFTIWSVVDGVWTEGGTWSESIYLGDALYSTEIDDLGTLFQ